MKAFQKEGTFYINITQPPPFTGCFSMCSAFFFIFKKCDTVPKMGRYTDVLILMSFQTEERDELFLSTSASKHL